MKSYYGDDEGALLKDFSSAINAMQANNKNVVFATHSGKGFDIPFIMRRLIVNRQPIPQMIDVAGLKPWLVNIIDIKELWQGTGFYSASLLNIAVALGLPSSKEDISGSETSDVYYNEEGGLERIVRYCERDVICTGNILLVMKGLDPFEVAEPLKADPPAGIMDKLHNSGVISEKEEKYLTKTIEKLTPEEQEIANELLKIVTTK